MLNVGLTGGIGAGKSAVSAALERHGAVVVDSDRLAREVVEPGQPALAEIVAAFGADVLDADGRLDRPRLGAIVFGDDAARRTLNGIVHPRVRQRSQEIVGQAPADGVVVHDIPLLVENGLDVGFPLVVVVTAPAELRQQRLVASRSMTAAEVAARMQAQATDEERDRVADVRLDNAGTVDDLESAVDRLWRRRIAVFADNLTQRRPAAPSGLRPTAADVERAVRRLRVAIVDVDGNGVAPGDVHDEVEAEIAAWSNDPSALRGAVAALGWFPTGRDADALRSADPGSGLRLQLRSPARPVTGSAGRGGQNRKDPSC